MRVVIAPDKFKGTLTAREVAEAIALGVRDAIPEAECVLLPMADGGDGTLDVLEAAGWARRHTAGLDARGRPVEVPYVTHDEDAVIEMAAVCGLSTLQQSERDPWVTTSFGLGSVARSLLPDYRVHLAIGGSASIDGGAGFLQGLGIPVRDAHGADIGPGLRGVSTAASIGDPPSDLQPFVVWSDVMSPLTGPQGAVALFGEQKGLTDLEPAEDVLAHWASQLEERVGIPVAERPGAGAAGGVGAAALALGAELVSGALQVANRIGVPGALAGADLVISGEGRLDRGTLAGKVPCVVADLAGDRPVLLVAGGCPDPGPFLERGYRVCGGMSPVLTAADLRRLVADDLVDP